LLIINKLNKNNSSKVNSIYLGKFLKIALIFFLTTFKNINMKELNTFVLYKNISFNQSKCKSKKIVNIFYLVSNE
jgi:hypothetical protein